MYIELPDVRPIKGELNDVFHIIFQDRKSMFQETDRIEIGTIVFVKQEDSFFGRISSGWRHIVMGASISYPPENEPIDEYIQKTESTKDHIDMDKSDLKHKTQIPHLRLAALNDPWSGDLHGVRGADYKCYRDARAAGFVGVFRAFLTHGTESLKSLVKSSDQNLPVLNIKGEILFNSWEEVFQVEGQFSETVKIYSFNEGDIINDSHWSQKKVWHGTNSAGTREKSASCKSWHTDNSSNAGLASDLLFLFNGKLLLGQENVECNQKLVVLCVEGVRASHDHSLHNRSRRSTELRINPSYNLTLYEYNLLLNEYRDE